MKKKRFIILFIAINIVIIFLYIHKQSTIIQLSFAKQRNEKIKEDLVLQKNKLEQQLQTMNNKSAIKEYASEKLHMKKINLKQINVITTQKGFNQE